jgi:hypothetical protein
VERSSAGLEDDLAFSFTEFLRVVVVLASNRRILVAAGELKLAHDCKLPLF